MVINISTFELQHFESSFNPRSFYGLLYGKHRDAFSFWMVNGQIEKYEELEERLNWLMTRDHQINLVSSGFYLEVGDPKPKTMTNRRSNRSISVRVDLRVILGLAERDAVEYLLRFGGEKWRDFDHDIDDLIPLRIHHFPKIHVR